MVEMGNEWREGSEGQGGKKAGLRGKNTDEVSSINFLNLRSRKLHISEAV
jgi:hypothetical protein